MDRALTITLLQTTSRRAITVRGLGLLFVLVGCAANAPSGPQILVNPGFEEGARGWSAAGGTNLDGAITDAAHSGTKAVRLVDKSDFVSQVVPVRPGSVYRLSGFVQGAASIGVKVGSDIFFEQRTDQRRSWKEVTVTFESEAQDSVTVFGSSAGGEVRLDDFRLYEASGGDRKLSARIRSSKSGGYGLSPDLAPGRNFELIDWYLNTPADDDNDGKSDRFSERQLAQGAVDPRYFYTGDDGGMVFRATVDGAKTSKNTKFTRTELREMLRRGDTKIRTRMDDGTPNKNNWVFSTSPPAAQRAAGGVDGLLRATLAVNHVTTSGEPGQVGRVIVGQIHARRDEPARLYYRKLPGHARGSIYLAHERSEGEDAFFDLIGSRASSAPEPPDGIALGEVFTYEIEARGHRLHVRILQGDELRAETVVNMADSGYDVAGEYMYFKAGVYNQNNTGAADDYVQATFYRLENSHRGYDD